MPAATVRYAAIVIGALQALANALLLVRGFTQLPVELAREHASERISDLLRIAWTYGMLGNLCLSVVLVWTAWARPAGDPIARTLAAIVGAYYLAVGVATYAFGVQRHAGLLIYILFAAVLLGTLALTAS
jgi:hypothetical protein